MPPSPPQSALLGPRPAPPYRLRPWQLAVAAAVLVGLAWGAAWERVRFVRQQTLAAETAKNDNLALAHAETLSKQIDLLDQLMKLVRDDHLRLGPVPDLRARVALANVPPGGIVALTVTDRTGRAVSASIANLGTDYSDRDYFRQHLADPVDRLILGPPVLGKQTGQWVVTLSRPLIGGDGAFAGVIVVAVDPSSFARLYASSRIEAGGSLALIGLDGITRMRRNGNRVSYGEVVKQSHLFSELKRSPVGRYEAVAASDGVRRTVSYRQLEAYPMVVVVASSADDLALRTAVEERTAWAAAGLVSLLVGALAALGVLAQRRNDRAMASLREAETRLRLLWDNSFDAMLRTRLDGSVLAANAAACRLFGRTEPELVALGRDGLVDGQDPRLPELLAERASQGRVEGRVRLRRGDGTLFEAEVSAVVYADADGQPASSLTVRDLTQPLAAEAERVRLEQRLREAQKLESIGTLAGGIAHDFNNILAVILGNAALMREDLAQGRAAEEPLARITQSAVRARALVQQILAFSRRAPEQREPQALQPLLRESAAMLQATLPAAVRLELSLPAVPLVVSCDGTQVQQVVVNLCTNAWQAMPAQRGHVRVSLEEGRCEGRGPLARCAVLRVQDDGCGIDEATRARIFEPFFTTKPVGQGTGLGLAVVHGIVTAHGGTITVDSAPGAGTTFEIRLPLLDAAAGAAAPPAAPPDAPAQGCGEAVMYVDDDPVLAVTVERLLGQQGWRVLTCRGAAEALERLRAASEPVALVVTDYNMPGMSGLELAAALATLRPSLPVVVTSGFVSDELVARAQACGVRHVMLKEFTLEHLPALVQRVLAEAPAAGAPAPVTPA